MTRPSVAVRLLSLLCLLALSSAGLAEAPDDQEGGPKEFKRLKFRAIGPAAGGRVCRSAGVPGDPSTCYAATAAGGVWKSADGGFTWKPITDKVPLNTAGSLAIAPSDPNVIYVGAGEANIRGNVEVGNGIFKSSDAGKTWQHVWKQEGQIGTLVVHPSNPDTAFAAVLGHAFGPSKERGIYRTTDGGKSWKNVLFKDLGTGGCDIALDPNNPRILFAALWQVRRRPWELTSGGPGSGIWTSRDGGDTWTRLVALPPEESPERSKEPDPGTRRCKGLPKGIWGKVGLAIAPSDSKRIYALIEAEEGGLFRSDDGGETWERVNEHRALRQRAWYFSTITVDPKNPNIVWAPQVPLLKSIDAGKTFARVKGPHHGDHHDIWIDPKNPERVIDSNDGGVDLSLNGGKTWFAPQLPIAQFYHIDVDNSTPYNVAGSMQDIGTAGGPSNSLLTIGIPLSSWYPVGGGEAGHVAFDPTDPHTVFGGEYGGYISRYDHRTRQAKSIGVYPFNPSGHGAEDLKYRFQWTAPILASKHEKRTVYHGGNVLFATKDDGVTWKPISPDLTRNDKSKQKWSGGPITGDNTGVEVYGTIFALAESRSQKGVLWAGSDDGLVHVTRDGGKTWSNVTSAIKGLPEWGTVIGIECSPFDPATAYVVVDAHKLDDRKPYLFKTHDFGKTWTSLAGKMPVDGYLQVVREDPKQKGLLYAGWERGLIFSRDGGASWEELKLNFPPVRVTDIHIKEGDLVVSTNGRSLWVLDDLTPVREWSAEVAKKDAHLFPVRQAVRWRRSGSLREGFPGWMGSNPPEGVIVHYSLGKVPKGEVTLRVLDADGKVVRTLSSKKEEKEEQDLGGYSPEKEPEPLPVQPGLHRVVWDLRYEGAKTIKGARLDGGQPKVGPLVNPGTYTLELNVEGAKLTQKVLVALDPRAVPGQQIALGRGARPDLDVKPRPIYVGVPEDRTRAEERIKEELQEQLRLALAIRDDITCLTKVVEQIRSVRKQVQAREEVLKDDPKAAELVKGSKELLAKLDELEGKLHNPKAKVSYDILAMKGGAQLYSQLAWLLELLKDADGKPTQGVKEVHKEQHELLEKYAAEWERLVKEEVGRLNEAARKAELPGVVVPR